MQRDGIEFHNVSACRTIDGDGVVLQRVPEHVRTALNEGAQARMRHPAGVELRFVPEGPVAVTLSTASSREEESLVRVFWGPIQDTETFVIGPEPTTVELSVPEPLHNIRSEALDPLAYDPRVCRLVLSGEHRGTPICYHGVVGDHRPPAADEVPDHRYLAYGTSITEGEAPIAEHLTYVNQTARRIGADPINLGSCGTAYCDAAMADHIAAREDWDVATLALSVNMVDRFSSDEFRSRAAYMVDTIADAHPTCPIACITIYPNARDVCTSEANRCERFRETLREVVDEAPENVHLFEGPDILPDIGGLTTDLVHPGDNAMIRMGENLAAKLETIC